MLPYEYRLHVRGWDGSPMRLDVDMVSLKAPMLVGGEGLVDIGDGQSYYYCHSRIDVAGTIRVHGLQEQVTGQAWIDHQWGDFLPQDQDVSWEWFSIQLDDGREIMVADLWLDGELQGSYSGGLNLYNEDCSLELLEDYTITPLDTWADPDSDRTFATQWEIEEPTRDIHLIVTAEFDNQVMRLTPGFVFTPTFWEGSCWVSGTIDGQAVSGRCYAELTHSIEASPYGEQYDGQTRDP